MATLGVATPMMRAKSMAFWMMSFFSCRFGLMFSAASVIEQRLGVQRHVKAEHVRHAAARAQRVLGQHGLDHLVGVQAALHDHFDLAARSHASAHLGRSVAVLHINDLDTIEVDVGFRGHQADALGGANQHRARSGRGGPNPWRR